MISIFHTKSFVWYNKYSNKYATKNYKSLKVCTSRSLLYWQGSLEGNPRLLIGSFLVGISPYRLFPCLRSEAVYFLFSKAGNFKTSMARVPYNKLLSNLVARAVLRNISPPAAVFCMLLAELGPSCHVQP